LDELVAALTLLTRLPVGWLRRPWSDPSLASAVWAFPVVGLLLGTLGGVAYWAVHRFGLPPLLAAVWTLGVLLVLTGAFHEDGLADVADGFGGGRTAERKLEIMRDSRIGTYGALALVWSCLVRVAAIASLGRPGLVMFALIVAASIARGGMIILLATLKPARTDGIAASLGTLPGGRVALGLGIALVTPFFLLPVGTATVVVLCGLLTCLAISWLARQQIGGHTGDVLGAAEVVVECVVLTALAALLR